MEEVWKPCRDNPFYEVSNYGQIRTYEFRHRWLLNESIEDLKKHTEPIIMSQSLAGRGYFKVTFHPIDEPDPKIRKNYLIHRLVADLFVYNDDPSVKTQVNHIDGNKQNNRADNLEWVSPLENTRHAIATGLMSPKKVSEKNRLVNAKLILCNENETVYYGKREVGRDLGIDIKTVSDVCSGVWSQAKGYTLEYCSDVDYRSKLYLHQADAVDRLKSGKILVGTVGSGKSRTALAYFWQYECDRMRHPKDLYIITTARKRDSLEWQGECVYFGIDPYNENKYSKVHLTVDSWNNIQKYVDVQNAFFIFDEQRVVGYGKWTKSFLKISKKNRWILLSGTPGDTWMDYIPVFIANGFYKNKAEFVARHVVYSRFSKFPKVEKYLDIEILKKHKAEILVEMEFEHFMQSHIIKIKCAFNQHDLMRIFRGRWDIFKNVPISSPGSWCHLMREVVNQDHTRLEKVLDIFEKHHKIIVFYNFDFELAILNDGLSEYLYGRENIVEVHAYNGHTHDPLPESDEWVYLVQYNAGSEAWNCITTDTIVFYSLNYSYKIMEQASGRIRRMNSPFNELYYYILYSESVIDRSILTALKNKKEFQATRLYNRTFSDLKIMSKDEH